MVFFMNLSPVGDGKLFLGKQNDTMLVRQIQSQNLNVHIII